MRHWRVTFKKRFEEVSLFVVYYWILLGFVLLFFLSCSKFSFELFTCDNMVSVFALFSNSCRRQSLNKVFFIFLRYIFLVSVLFWLLVVTLNDASIFFFFFGWCYNQRLAWKVNSIALKGRFTAYSPRNNTHLKTYIHTHTHTHICQLKSIMGFSYFSIRCLSVISKLYKNCLKFIISVNI